MHIIRDKNAKAKINEFGAELKSFTVNEAEVIWQSNPNIWKKSAPILFPVVGRLKNKKYTYKGIEYFLPIHGFAKDNEFKVENKTGNSISFVLESTNETKKVYPFDFSLKVIFSIQNNILNVKYEVKNNGIETMFFSLGSHPAIDLPLKNTSLNDYYVEFDEKEFLHRYELIDGLVKKQTQPYLNNENIIRLSENIFNDDALIFTKIKSKSLNIKNDKTQKNIKICLGAPDIGIWSKPGADYVCIEPWFGYDDPVNSNNKLEEKPGIQTLNPNNKFTTSYSIEALSI
jgi:galactose mutarotase-like enzyme